MKKVVLFALICSTCPLCAQLFFTENFESAPSTYTPDANTVCNSTDYFTRTDGSNISANQANDYSNFEGSFYWAGESHDDVLNGSPGSCSVGNGAAVKSLVFNPIDISGLSLPDIRFSALFGGNEVSNSLEGDEFVSIEYSFDNSSFTTLMEFTPVENVPIAGRDQLCLAGNSMTCMGEAMQTFAAQFPKGANTTLYLVVTAGNNSSSEEWAIDNITLTNVAALPVEFISFRAKKVEEEIFLKWVTTVESNNEGFVIQHAIDGVKWKDIGFVAGAGAFGTEQVYTYIHANPMAGENYYRLKQIDFDGAADYSKIISILTDDVFDVQILPNPTSGLVEVTGVQAGIFHVLDSNGQLVKEGMIHDDMIEISDLPKGVYFLQIITDQHVFTRQLLKI